MTAWPDLRMGPLALSMRYSVRLLSNSGVAGELRYFGPSPSSSRPPSPTAWPFWSRIGKSDAGPELVVDAAATALARRREADLDELLGPDVALGAERPGHLVPAARRPAELVGLDRLVGEAAAVEVVEGGLAGVRGRSARRGRRRSRCRGRRAAGPGGRPRAWSARRSRRRPAGRASEAPPGR